MTDDAVRAALDEALAHHRGGRLEEAEAIYRRILAAHPAQPETLYLLGVIAYRAKRYTAAIELIGKAIAGRPDVADFHNDLANALRLNGDLPAAVEAYRQAISLGSPTPNRLNNLGATLKLLDRPEEAVEVLRQAAEIAPDNASILNNLGASLQAAGHCREARESYCRAVAIKPDYPEAQNSLGMLRMLLGDYERGLAGYEWRWRVPSWPEKPRALDKPAWDGGPLGGRTIMLHTEQGLGDTMQFIRYAPLIQARGGRVVVCCPQQMIRLLRSVDGVAAFHPILGPTPAFDVHAPFMSLPHLLGTTVETIPADIPYLRAEPALIETWRERLASVDGLRVGIAWRGNPNNQTNHERSFSAADLAPLGRIPGVRLVSLQKNDGRDPLADLPAGIAIEDIGPELDDFADTAAAMANLDLIISCCTSIAHLAGALGRPAWVALKQVPDWRWMLQRDDSPWYPTLRLFRQRRRGDWAPVFERIGEALAAVASGDRRALQAKRWSGAPASEPVGTAQGLSL